MTIASETTPATRHALGQVSAAARQTEAPAAPARLGPLLRGPILFGAVVVIMFFGVFGLWAALAPLSSGAIASGVVSPDSANPAIQHLEGGIISDIHVREGQHVKVGDLLVTLASTRVQAGLSAQREEWLRLLIQQARVAATMDEADVMAIPEQLEQFGTPGIDEFLSGEQKLFDSRQTSYRQQIEIYDRQIEQFRSESRSVLAENEGLRTQINLIDLEIADKQKLLDQQLIARSDLLALQRQQAALAASIAANEARVARINQSIEEVGLAKLQEYQSMRDRAAQEAADINNRLAQIEQELVAVSDQMDRTEIRSPVDGVVLNMRFERSGGVVAPGATIMDIVPLDEDMVILAQLAPRDIDSISVGQMAHVTLVPFSSRNELPLNGEVVQVAADSTTNERTGLTYYEVRVKVSGDELGRHDGMYMAPGMPVDITVVTGERTMLQYLAEPLLRSIRRAFVYD